MNTQLEKFYNGIALGLTNPVGPVIIFQRSGEKKISCWLGYDHIAEIIQNFAAEQVGIVDYYDEPFRLEQAQQAAMQELVRNEIYAPLISGEISELEEIETWPEFISRLNRVLARHEIIPEPRLEFQMRQGKFYYQAQTTGKNSCGLSCYRADSPAAGVGAAECFDSPASLFERLLTARNSSYRLFLGEDEIINALKNRHEEFIPETDPACTRHCYSLLEQIIRTHPRELPAAHAFYETQRPVAEL